METEIIEIQCVLCGEEDTIEIQIDAPPNGAYLCSDCFKLVQDRSKELNDVN